MVFICIGLTEMNVDAFRTERKSTLFITAKIKQILLWMVVTVSHDLFDIYE